MQGVAVELLALERKPDPPAICPGRGPALRPADPRVANEVDPTGVHAFDLIEGSLKFVRGEQVLDDGVTVLPIVIDVLVGDGHEPSCARWAVSQNLPHATGCIFPAEALAAA